MIWQNPLINWTKLNADGVSKGNLGEAGSGGIIHSNNCDFTFSFVIYLNVCSSINAEEKAIHLEIKHAKRLGITSLWRESDSLDQINVLNEVLEIPWSITYIIHGITTLLKNIKSLLISHICREGNTVADIMANSSITNKAFAHLEDKRILPKEARGALILNKFGLPELRKKKYDLFRILFLNNCIKRFIHFSILCKI